MLSFSYLSGLYKKTDWTTSIEEIWKDFREWTQLNVLGVGWVVLSYSPNQCDRIPNLSSLTEKGVFQLDGGRELSQPW